MHYHFQIHHLKFFIKFFLSISLNNKYFFRFFLFKQLYDLSLLLDFLSIRLD